VCMRGVWRSRWELVSRVLLTLLSPAALRSTALSLPCLPSTAYPMGLPEYDVIRAIIEDREEITGSAASADHLDPDSAELWCVTGAVDGSTVLSSSSCFFLLLHGRALAGTGVGSGRRWCWAGA
jgi:hypothetical protein